MRPPEQLGVVRTDAPGLVPLFVLAGFPQPVARHVQERLRAASMAPRKGPKEAHYLALDFPNSAQIYSNRQTIESLIGQVGAFTIKRRAHSDDEVKPTPSRIFLLYVESKDDELLLEAFDFFVFPVPLGEEGTWRRDATAALAATERVVVELQKDAYRTQQLAMEVAGGNSAHVLPARNYFVGGNVLAPRFRAARRTVVYDDVQADLLRKKYRYEDLPDVMNGRMRARFFEDGRGIVFPPTPTPLRHGPARELPEAPPPTAAELRATLNQLYRFGMPIASGFHYDAQYPGGKHLHNVEFDCVHAGKSLVSGPYVNVYPNDFIRTKS